MMEVHHILSIKAKMTTAHHLQTNGQTKRFNRTIFSALRKFCADHPHDWYLLTNALTFGYNCNVHISTGLAPFDLVLSRTRPLLRIETEPQGGDTSPRQARLGG